MDNNYLAHHGIKGQKWGVRRYQTKDGSLTTAGKKRYSKGDGKKKDVPEETPEQKRARLLKSTDSHDLYKNRHLLTTAELNERITRIDTEKRLGSIAAQDKRGAAKFLENVKKVSNTANDIYKITQSDLGKAIMSQLKGKEEPAYNRNDIKSIWENRNKISDKDLESLKKRHKNIQDIKKILDGMEVSDDDDEDND